MLCQQKQTFGFLAAQNKEISDSQTAENENSWMFPRREIETLESQILNDHGRLDGCDCRDGWGRRIETAVTIEMGRS